MFSKENVFATNVETPRYHLCAERVKMVSDARVQMIDSNICESNS